jgi:hypothetical protein
VEHAYRRSGNAWKNHYLLLQISQLLNAPVRLTDNLQETIGNPGSNFARVFGSTLNFADRFMESLRTGVLGINGLPTLDRLIRIRLLRCCPQGGSASRLRPNAVNSQAVRSFADGKVGWGRRYPAPAARAARNRRPPRAAKQTGRSRALVSAPPSLHLR